MTYQILNPTTGEIKATLNDAAIRRLQAAERRANHRDFDNRYGSTTRHPYGVVSPARRPRKYQPRTRRPGREASLVVELAKAVVVIVVGFASMALLYAVM